MLVVADTSPVNYLVLIRQIEILPRLYARILIPVAVFEELKRAAAPRPVQEWIGHPPTWLEVLSPKNRLSVDALDLGESDAIALATETHAELLLIDDLAGRQEATKRGLRVAGTLAVLVEAGRAGLLDFDAAVASLGQTSFRMSRAILEEIERRRLS